MGIKVPTLPNQTSVPSSINILGTLRVGGIEKTVIFQGLDIRPSKLTSVNNRLTSLSAVLENRLSAVSSLAVGNSLSPQITSINSRITNLSATLENRLSAVSAIAGGGGYNDASISARITSALNKTITVSGKVTSVNSRVVTVSTKLTSINENTTSALSRIATFSDKVTSVNTRIADVSALFRTSVFLLSGASVNITSVHRNKTVRLNHNAAMRARLMATGWLRNDFVNLIQWGSGQVSVGSAAILRSRGSKFQSAGQYGVVAALLVSANEFVITGDVSA